MSQAIATSRKLRNKKTRLDLSVPDFHEVPGLLTNDVVFHVIVITSLAYFKTIVHKRIETVQFMVEKRYSDFEAIHKSLSDCFPAIVLPQLPRKVLMLKDSTPLEQRASFDNLMKFVSANPKLASSSILLAFLGVKPETIKSVEQMALDEAEAAKLDMKKEEKDIPYRQNSKDSKRPSIGLFDEVDNDADLHLFEENSIQEEELLKSILEEADSGLFSSSNTNGSSKGADPSIFSIEQHEGGSVPMLFEASGDIDDGNNIYLPPGAADVLTVTSESNAEPKEDYSDLLNIVENLDQLLLDTASQQPKKLPKPAGVQTRPTTSPKPRPTTSPKPRPTTTPKPQTASLQKPPTTQESGKTPPIPKPRLSLEKTQKSSEDTTFGGSEMTDSGVGISMLGDEDILKYIQENETAEEASLDLF